MLRIRSLGNREIVEGSLESGHRLRVTLKKLIQACETHQAKVDDGHKNKELQPEKDLDIGFIDSIFGRDRQLENTEKLMAGIRLWNLIFDANCEDILRRPHV